MSINLYRQKWDGKQKTLVEGGLHSLDIFENKRLPQSGSCITAEKGLGVGDLFFGRIRYCKLHVPVK